MIAIELTVKKSCIFTCGYLFITTLLRSICGPRLDFTSWIYVLISWGFQLEEAWCFRYFARGKAIFSCIVAITVPILYEIYRVPHFEAIICGLLGLLTLASLEQIIFDEWSTAIACLNPCLAMLKIKRIRQAQIYAIIRKSGNSPSSPKADDISTCLPQRNVSRTVDFLEHREVVSSLRNDVYPEAPSKVTYDDLKKINIYLSPSHQNSAVQTEEQRSRPLSLSF